MFDPADDVSLGPQRVAGERRARYSARMKSASLPAVSVEPGVRAELDAALEDGESMAEFIEAAVIERLARRRQARKAFLARGMASLEESLQSGKVHSLEDVERMLRERADEAVRRFRDRDDAAA